MFKRFFPSEIYSSTYAIPFGELYEQGYRGIIFDIDNTLVMHGAPATKESIALFEKLRQMGFKTCLISNNQLPRVLPFAKAVDSPFVEDAHKPSRKNYIRAMEIMGTNLSSTFFVGDQLFTDVYGANRAGMKSILVEPIDKKEEIQIVFKRKLEKIVLRAYEKEHRRDSCEER